MKTRQKRIQDDSVVVTCPKCGHKHSFVSLKALDKMPTSTSWAQISQEERVKSTQ